MIKCFFLTLVLVLFTVQPGQGHRLLLMAWLQGELLMVETAFGDGSMGAGIQVTVVDAVTEELILSGHSDQEGFFEAALPAEAFTRGNPLRVSASDGAGHLARQTIKAEELRSAQPQPAPSEKKEISRATGSPENGPPFNEELMRRIVGEAVRQEVAPLRREILALEQSRPGLTEILGGIGYIIGMASLGAWLLRRKNPPGNK